jgi:hypothetical protein
LSHRPPVVAVTTLFSIPLTNFAITYLISNFAKLIRPILNAKLSRISASSMEVRFYPPGNSLAAICPGVFEEAHNIVLYAANNNPAAGMLYES